MPSAWDRYANGECRPEVITLRKPAEFSEPDLTYKLDRPIAQTEEAPRAQSERQRIKKGRKRRAKWFKKNPDGWSGSGGRGRQPLMGSYSKKASGQRFGW